MIRFSTFALLATLVACDAPMEEVSTAGTNAVMAHENARGDRIESFQFGGDTSNAVVDYVFVMDNSISMKNILRRVQKGFKSLDPDRWPRDARIAVLGTLPHDLDDAEVLHPTVQRMSPRSIDDPGFTQFVSASSIQAQVKAVPELSKRFPYVGCTEWFSPEQKGPDGKPCIQAHTQITLDPTGAEAGLTALKQLLDRNQGSMTFRPGAAINVVFVSDTHDPGAAYSDSGDLLEHRPSAAELIALIERDNQPSSIRFHAIAPKTECVEPWKPFGPSYFNAAEATGGKQLDACKARDYRPILDAVVTDGAKPNRPVFGLGTVPDAVHDVTVDGQPVDFKVVGGTVELIRPPAMTTASEVEVHYHRKLDAVRPAVSSTQRKR